MANKQQEPRVVAELGRPETPQETADRKALNSKLHRQRQTVNNLVLSLLASLGIVLLLVLIVPRGVGDFETRSVDVAELAAAAEQGAGQSLVAPDLSDDWRAKQALLRNSRADKVTSWNIAYTTPGKQYAGVIQAFDASGQPANETWVAAQLENKLATGTLELAGLKWTVYDHQSDNKDETNVTYGLATELPGAVLLVFGTAEPQTIEILAEAAIASLQGK